MSKEAMKLALEALENSVDLVSHEARNAEELYGKYPSRLARIQGLVAFEVAHEKAITALREALAEQPAQQEPVAHRDGFWCADLTCKKCYSADFRFKHKNSVVNESLTTPAQRKPLTEEDAFDLVQQDYRMEEYTDAAMQLIRRTEAAHGIKENT